MKAAEKNLGITQNRREFFRLDSALVWNIAPVGLHSECWTPMNEVARKPKYYTYFFSRSSHTFQVTLKMVG